MNPDASARGPGDRRGEDSRYRPLGHGGAFSPACFALLGLWLVVVQIRLPAWEKDPERRRRSYGVALHFALPGIMSVFALIDVQTDVFWRWSLAVLQTMLTFLGPVPLSVSRRGHAPVATSIIGFEITQV
jgi:hypothetical protein